MKKILLSSILLFNFLLLWNIARCANIDDFIASPSRIEVYFNEIEFMTENDFKTVLTADGEKIQILFNKKLLEYLDDNYCIANVKEKEERLYILKELIGRLGDTGKKKEAERTLVEIKNRYWYFISRLEESNFST